MLEPQSNSVPSQNKQDQIKAIVNEIDAQLKRAATLFKEGNIAAAKDIYVKQCETMIELIKITADDKSFKEALTVQLKSVIQKVLIDIFIQYGIYRQNNARNQLKKMVQDQIETEEWIQY